MIDYNAQRLANFNPRSHEGSDSGYYHQGDRSCISIHAPTRGATLKDISIFINTLDFNPRSHEGSDAAESAGAATLQLFQSTLPRGSDAAESAGAATLQLFQSTLPRGERHK